MLPIFFMPLLLLRYFVRTKIDHLFRLTKGLELITYVLWLRELPKGKIHTFFFLFFHAKPSLKIGSVNKAFLFWYWQWLLFRNFFVFQDRKLKLSEFVWKRITWNLTKFQLNQTTDRKNENNNCLNKLNFCEVAWNVIQTNAEISTFYLEKQKKFYS